jgi:hypothetical protein
MSKEKTQLTIVLKDKGEREAIRQALSERGGKILHDSGERVLIVEVPKRTRLKNALPKTSKLLRLRDNVKRVITRPSIHELLFIDAMKLKNSRAYKLERMLREPGSTPEEKEMMIESDFIEGDINNI